MKKFRELERIVRGYSNHRRIQMLAILAKQPELSVYEVSDQLKINAKTASEHLRRLAIAGLIMKRNELNNVRHKLTSRGKSILVFLRTLE